MILFGRKKPQPAEELDKPWLEVMCDAKGNTWFEVHRVTLDHLDRREKQYLKKSRLTASGWDWSDFDYGVTPPHQFQDRDEAYAALRSMVRLSLGREEIEDEERLI